MLAAFGAARQPRPLTGGQGTSWLCGDLVLKPNGDTVHAWLADALAGITAAGFRLATPVRTTHGTWSEDGWSATRWLEGSPPDHTTAASWLRVIEAGRMFHRAVAHLDLPPSLRAREDRWAVADRVAWGEQTIRFHPGLVALRRRLQGALEPLGASQLVHGDLTNNVLFSGTLPPAVIDISPYWRPPAYAEGVVVADALCWHGAPATLLDEAGVSVPAVARALLFRVATTSQAVPHRDLDDEVRRYGRAAAAIGL